MTDVFISPHLDDAVLSCGEMLQRLSMPTVVTVFAGNPPTGWTSEYDVRCGFKTSLEAMQARRREDIFASNVLEFETVHCDLPEWNYRTKGGRMTDPLGDPAIVETIRPWIAGAKAVFIPLGLQHPDHRRLAEIAWDVAWEYDHAPVIYEELPYRVDLPFEVTERLDVHRLRHIADLDVPPRLGGDSLKFRALQCYSSQATQVDVDEALVKERFWRVKHDRMGG